MQAGNIIRITLISLLAITITFDLLTTVVFRGVLYRRYMSELDAWVASGGPKARIQSLVYTCGKLAFSQAGPIGMPELLFDKKERDFRGDVCFQVTVNRVYPQPRFDDPKMIDIVCKSEDDLFVQLCRHASLDKAR